jgi:site-specific DNA recombinase
MGTCGNRLGISRQALEQTILNGFKSHLMNPKLFKEFCTEFIKEVNRFQQDQAAQRSGLEAELARIDRRIRKIVDAIADGVPARSLKDELLGLDARQDQIKASLTASPEPKVYLAPSMADIYSQKVGELHQVLAAGSEQPEVYDALRSLVDRVMLTPIDGALRIDLHGEIAEILKLSAGGKKQAAEVGQAAKQFVMVAGARSHLYRTELFL